MKRFLVLCIGVAACFWLSCNEGDIIAKGKDYMLTVDDLRYEVTKLGPSANYHDTFDDRVRVVQDLATRKLLCDEALRLGLVTQEDLESALKDAESKAVGNAYHMWRVDKQILLPRIKTKPWIEKLDRKLHLKDLVFKVYPEALEAKAALNAGADFDSLAAEVTKAGSATLNDMGWIIWKDVGRDVANHVFKLDRGEATDIMRQVDGYHIYWLAEDEKFGLGIELLSLRSKRFVQAMEKERLEEEEKAELAKRYNVKFNEHGLKRGLDCFAISFQGGRPPDSLLNVVVATYEGGKVLVADLYSYYYALPIPSRSYIGDFYGLTELAMEIVLPELESYAGYEMGLDRLRDVRWEVKKAKEDLLVPQMEDYFRSKISVSEDDMKAYYEERKGDLKTSGRYRLRRLLLDSWDKVPEFRRRLASGEDFVDIIGEMSKDTYTASSGGDLGFINFGLVAAYDSVVSSLDVGEISKPFKTRVGVEVVRLEEIEEPRQLTYEEAQPYIRQFIVNSRANDLLGEWAKKKKQEIGFWINEDLLRTVRLPQPEYVRLKAKPSEEAESKKK